MISLFEFIFEIIKDFFLVIIQQKTLLTIIEMTKSGLIAGAHLVGAGNGINLTKYGRLYAYLKTNGSVIPGDDLGTTIEDYIY